MKAERFFECLNCVEEQYLLDARKANIKAGQGKRSLIKAVVLIAACLILFLGISLVSRGTSGIDYTVLAAELGRAELQLGATMPTIIYADEVKVIMYDYIGIWVYDMKKEKLAGFCDFRSLDMTRIQGAPCVFVEATADGRYVKFYMSDGSRKYLYDVEKDSYESVERYDSTTEQPSQLRDVTETYSLSEYSQTYEIPEGEYISYTFNFKQEEVLRYEDLVIVISEEGKVKEFRPFY